MNLIFIDESVRNAIHGKNIVTTYIPKKSDIVYTKITIINMRKCQACLTLYMKELAILLFSECPKNDSFANISI